MHPTATVTLSGTLLLTFSITLLPVDETALLGRVVDSRLVTLVVTCADVDRRAVVIVEKSDVDGIGLIVVVIAEVDVPDVVKVGSSTLATGSSRSTCLVPSCSKVVLLS